MSGHTLLVTGGAGYIGAHAVLALRDAGREVVVVDNLSTGQRAAVPAGVAFHQGDVADAGLVGRVLRDHAVGAVMHFAGSISVPESVADPLKYYANNTAASLSLARACIDAGVGRFIFSSSASVYGVPDHSPIGETAPAQPISPYARSKLMTETMLGDLSAARHDFRAVCLRYFNVAGADPAGRAGQRDPNAAGLIRLALQTALGRRACLDVCGDDYDTRDGTGERDYIHVSDLAAAHLAVVDYLEGGGASVTLNCGYGRGYTVLEVIGALEAILGRQIPTRRAPRRPGDMASSVSDIAKLRATLPWRPRFDSLEVILNTALAWQGRDTAPPPVQSAETP